MASWEDNQETEAYLTSGGKVVRRQGATSAHYESDHWSPTHQEDGVFLMPTVLYAVC